MVGWGSNVEVDVFSMSRSMAVDSNTNFTSNRQLNLTLLTDVGFSSNWGISPYKFWGKRPTHQNFGTFSRWCNTAIVCKLTIDKSIQSNWKRKLLLLCQSETASYLGADGRCHTLHSCDSFNVSASNWYYGHPEYWGTYGLHRALRVDHAREFSVSWRSPLGSSGIHRSQITPVMHPLTLLNMRICHGYRLNLWTGC